MGRATPQQDTDADIRQMIVENGYAPVPHRISRFEVNMAPLTYAIIIRSQEAQDMPGGRKRVGGLGLHSGHMRGYTRKKLGNGINAVHVFTICPFG